MTIESIIMRNLASGRFILEEKLGAGSFGEIHAGKDTQTGERVAIKLERVKSKTPQLSFETKLYKILEHGTNVAKLHWFGTESDYNAMVIDLLGKSLEDLASKFNHRLSLKTVLMLADQMLSAVEYMHSRHLIHRDIKPDNFVMGLGANSNKVYIIDFGLSKRYRDPNTHHHMLYKEGKDLTGTARYASVSALKGAEQSRRDDLEALGFVWVYLLKGRLPWMGLAAKNRKQKYESIYTVKKNTSFEELCQGLPEEFVIYLQSVRQLKFTEEPEYAKYRKLFRQLFKRLGYVYDYQYDWTNTATPAVNEQSGALSDRVKRIPGDGVPIKQSSRSKRDANEKEILPRHDYSTAVGRSKNGESNASNADANGAVRYKMPKTSDKGKSEADKGFKIPIQAKASPRQSPVVRLPRRRLHTVSDAIIQQRRDMPSTSSSNSSAPRKASKQKPISESDDSSFAFDDKPRERCKACTKRPLLSATPTSSMIVRSRSREDSLRNLADGKKLTFDTPSDSSYDEFAEQERRKAAIAARKKEQMAVTDIEDVRQHNRHSLERSVRRHDSDVPNQRRPAGSPRKGTRQKTSVIPSWMIDRVRSGK